MFKNIIFSLLVIFSVNTMAKDVSYFEFVKGFTKKNSINLIISPEAKDFEIVLHGAEINAKAAVYKLITMLGTQNGVATIIDEDKKSLYLEPVRSIRYRDLHVYKDIKNLPNDYRFVRFLYTAKHMNPKSLTRNMRPLLHRYGRITNSYVTRQIIISDTAINIKKILNIFDAIDTPKTRKNELKMRDMNNQFKEDAKTREGFLVVLSKHQILFVILFSLIFLVIGFMIRGYLIKRIEGGL